MKIFVSYSRRDAGDFANQIQKHLSTFNYDIFVDVNSIKGGDIWNNTIEENISGCDIFVVILTHGAVNSKHVEREVLQAKEQKKTIIPCFHESAFTRLALIWGLDVIQGLQFDDKYDLARKLYLTVDNIKKTIEKSQPSSKDTTIQENNFTNSYQRQLEKAKGLEEIGQYTKALKAYDEALKINPNNFEANYNKGLLHEKMGDFENARKSLDKATDIDWKHKDVWYELGKVLEKLEKYGEAIEALNTDLRIDNKDIKSWSAKANILVKLEKYNEALESYNKVLEFDPKNIEILNNKGDILKRLTRCDESFKCYDKVLEIESNNVNAKKNKEIALEESKKESKKQNKKLALKRLSEETLKHLSEEKKMASDYLAIVNETIVVQMVLSSRERLSKDKEIKPYKFHLDNKIVEPKEEIIQELTHEIQKNRIIELTEQVSRLIRNVGYFYDSPTSDKIKMLLNDVGKLFGSLVTEINYVDKPKLVFHVFTLYVLCICLYSLIQFERILRYVDNDDETSAIIKMASGEINQAYSKYDYIYDKAYKLIESRFSELTVEKIEPWHKHIMPGGTMIYKINYKFDNNTIEAIDLKIKQTSKSDYNKAPRPDAIIKVRGDNYYYLWPHRVNEKTLYTDAFNKRKKHIEDILHKEYNEFISNKGNFMRQIEYHSKIFTNKNFTS